jgi:hypothetical protein
MLYTKFIICTDQHHTTFYFLTLKNTYHLIQFLGFFSPINVIYKFFKLISWRISILFYFFILLHIWGLRTYPYPKRVPDFRIYLIALRCEGVIIPQKNCCGRIIKKIGAYYFSGCNRKQFFFRPKISDVSTIF